MNFREFAGFLLARDKKITNYSWCSIAIARVSTSHSFIQFDEVDYLTCSTNCKRTYPHLLLPHNITVCSLGLHTYSGAKQLQVADEPGCSV